VYLNPNSQRKRILDLPFAKLLNFEPDIGIELENLARLLPPDHLIPHAVERALIAGVMA
jgi:hypothetical protein